MTSLKHPDVRVTLDALKEPRCTYWQLDGLMGSKQVLVHTKSLGNLTSALMERVFYEKQTKLPPALPRAGYIRRTLSEFRSSFLVNRSPATPMHPLKYALSYQARKRRIYEKAALDYIRHGVDQRDSELKVFVKYEKILETGERVVPRMISPRSPKYNVALGCYLKPLEYKIYHRCQKMFEKSFGGETPVVAKGFNAEQTAHLLHEKFERFSHPVVIGLDASRFDQHVCVDMLKYEHSFYTAYYQREKELSKLLKMQLHNKGIGVTPDGVLRYTVQGTRASGDVNTALGNCLISVACLWSFLRKVGITKADAFVNGDDVVLFLEREDVGKVAELPKYYLDLGFRMKVETPVEVFEGIEFCQTHPVFDGQKWVMVRNFPDCISKDSTIIHPVFAGDGAADYLSSVGACGISLCGGIPVLQEYYEKLHSLGKPRDTLNEFISSGFKMMAKGMAREHVSISQAARESFDRAFGCSPEEQIALEARVRAWRWGDTMSYSEPRPLVF